MSFRIVKSLAGAVIGTTDSIDWTGQIGQGASTGVKAGTPHVRVFNDTGCMLDIQFSAGHQDTIPAGAWPVYEIRAGETKFSYTVQDIIPNGRSRLVAVVYEPGEPVPPTPALGNSPIGLSGSVNAVTTKIALDTTAGDQVGIEFGPDPHSLSDWELLFKQNGDLQLWDNKNGRAVWTGRFSDGALNVLVQLIATKLSTDGGAIVTNGAGLLQILADTTLGNKGVLALFDTHNNKQYEFFLMQADGSLLIQETATGNFVLRLSPSNGISEINNQLTAGSFGVPVVVAQALDVHVTVTTLQTILSFTPAATGLYRVNAEFNPNNGGVNKAAITCTYTGGNNGNVQGPIAFGTAGGVLQDGSNAQVGNIDSILTPLAIYASSAAPILCQYQNNAGAPNDHVTFVIERLA